MIEILRGWWNDVFYRGPNVPFFIADGVFGLDKVGHFSRHVIFTAVGLLLGGAANLNIPNKGIRGHLHFAGNCLVDTVPGVTGVTDNSFVFLTWKGTAAPTSPLAWKYLGVDSIAVYCAIADSTAGRVSGYDWLRLE